MPRCSLRHSRLFRAMRVSCHLQRRQRRRVRLPQIGSGTSPVGIHDDLDSRDLVKPETACERSIRLPLDWEFWPANYSFARRWMAGPALDVADGGLPLLSMPATRLKQYSALVFMA